MNVIFLGPPGAGKGTQAANVSLALAVPHISTGDMFRSAIKRQTPTGMKAKAFMDEGKLVPDEVTIEMVKERLNETDAKNGYLLDGFPRTVDQAEALNEISAPDAVVNIHVDDDKLMARLTGRRVCAECAGTFHITKLTDPTVCPVCGKNLIHRADDQPETIGNRLSVYHAQTSPLIEYYDRKNLLITVNGDQQPDTVGSQILEALESRA